MPVSFGTFERLKDKGVSAYRAGEYGVARTYLVQAADAMIELAENAPSDKLRKQHEGLARELIELAKSCENRKAAARPARAKEDEDRAADANDWIVREKPSVTFGDIAGLEDVKQEIRLKMIYPFTHPELANHNGVSVGGGVLLFGPPGTGKTM